jgi:beta-lactam-binding protein with PASTA domain
MRINLPERITGARDTLFVLHVEFGSAVEERRLDVRTTGSLEALDLRGTGPGGSYTLPVGQRELHIPLRVTADGVAAATVEVQCTAGPEAGRTERRELSLVAATAAASSGSKLAVTLLVLLGLLGVGLVFGPKLFGGGAKAPSLVGKTEEAAVAALRAAKLKVKLTESDVDAPGQDGKVLRQIPTAGSSVQEGSQVEVVVGRYQPPILTVPELVGAKVAQAEDALRAAGFQSLITYQPPPSPEKVGVVLKQSPEGGATLERDRVVELYVGKVPEGVAPTPTPEPAPTPTPEPTPGPGDPDGPVDPAPTPTPTPEPGPTPTPEPAPEPGDRSVLVPDIVGMTKAAADWKLGDDGLLSEYEEVPGTPEQAGRVISQEPAPGSRLKRFSAVKAKVGARAETGPIATPTPTPTPEPGPIPEPGPTPTPTPTPEPPPTVPDGQVPDVIGMSRQAAVTLLRSMGFEVQVVLRPTADVQDGLILTQRPSAGEALAAGGSVALEVAQAPASSGALERPPAVGPGTSTPLVNTPRSPGSPPNPVLLPDPGAPASGSVPGVAGQPARGAIDTLLKSGLMPIVENDRNQPQHAGVAVRVDPAAGSPVRAGALVRVHVGIGPVVGERSVNVPFAIGADLAQADTIFRRQGLSVEIVELDVPGHPYAGTGRVVSQYPVSTVPMSQGKVITLWVIR